MKFLTERQSSAAHMTLAGLWTGLVIPTLIFWSESIRWVLIISIYANIASHLAAAEASSNPETDARLDRALAELSVFRADVKLWSHQRRARSCPLRTSVSAQNRRSYTLVTKRGSRRSTGL
jgi:hypothetical protein